MLSRCAPFTNRVQYAEGVLGAPISVYAVVESLCGRLVKIELTRPDEQHYTDWTGKVTCVSSKDIKELVGNYLLLFPSLTVKSIKVVVRAGEQEFTETLNCPPLNPELIATVTRKLLKGAYASRH